MRTAQSHLSMRTEAGVLMNQYRPCSFPCPWNLRMRTNINPKPADYLAGGAGGTGGTGGVGGATAASAAGAGTDAGATGAPGMASARYTASESICSEVRGPPLSAAKAGIMLRGLP